MGRPHISHKIKEQVYLRAKGRCEYCQSRSNMDVESFEIEHIIPLILNGKSDLTNLALACRGCNSRKSVKIKGIDPTFQKEVYLFNPRVDRWKAHFAWDENYLTILGKTPKGRATISTLKLNRIGLINLRSLMILGKAHPPIDTL